MPSRLLETSKTLASGVTLTACVLFAWSIVHPGAAVRDAPSIDGSASGTLSDGAAADACRALTRESLTHAKVIAAQVVTAGAFVPPPDGSGRMPVATAASPFRSLPPFCRVEVTSSPVTGSSIGSETWLPLSTWNGRFQAVGNRGWGGSISYQALAGAVVAGFASASTDTGHRGAGAAFALDAPEKVIDSGYRAVHDTTMIAKQLIARFYERPASSAYWNGCSLGGRQGLAEAQRYPTDYDGIFVGDPVNNLVDLYSARLAIARRVHRSSGSAIPPAKYPALRRAILDACDRIDGVADGVLEDPRQCRFDPAAIACPAGDGPGCLTPEQVDTARTIYAPVVHPVSGRHLSAGMYSGSELGWGSIAGPDPENNALGLFRFVVLGRADWDWRGDDFAAAIDRARAFGSPVLDATDANLAPFIDRGGKLLLYHGWADAQTSPGNTLSYYQAVIDRIGGRRCRRTIVHGARDGPLRGRRRHRHLRSDGPAAAVGRVGGCSRFNGCIAPAGREGRSHATALPVRPGGPMGRPR